MAHSMKGVPVFLAIAFGFSWTVAGVGWFTNAVANPLFYFVMLTTFMLGPSIAALVCVWFYDKGRRGDALGFLNLPFNLWLIPALVLPIVATGLALAVTLGATEQTYKPLSVTVEEQLAAQGVEGLPMPLWLLLTIQIVFGVAFNWLWLLVSEELGWRGWLYDRWSRFGFWKCAGLTGLVWGAWHAPIIATGYNYPGMPFGGMALMVVFTLLVSPMIHLVRERGGNVAHAALFHGSLNAFAPASLLMSTNPDVPWNGILGLGGFIALALCVAGVWAYRRWRPLPGAQAVLS